MNYSALVFAIVASVLCVQSQDIPGMPNCDPAVVTWHPHPLVCTQYVLCFHGNPIERLCAPGLHFSKVMEQCMMPQLAMCDINYACPEVDDELNPVFLPDGDDCSKYFVCFKGSPISRDCATGLWWDVVYNWCTTEDTVTCDARVPNNPRPPTTTEPPTTLPPTEPPTTLPPTEPPTTLPPTDPPTTLPQTEPPTTPPTTTQNPNTYDCPLSSEPSFHPHSQECHKYFICINGVAFLRECAEGLLFDIIERKCYDSELATCISGTNAYPVLNVAEGKDFKCPIHVNYEILFFPHQSKCNKFYLCEKGVAFLQKCPASKFYDITTEKCQDEETALCLEDL